MSKFTGTSFPNNPSYGDDFFHISQNLLYRFLGGDPSSPLNWIIYDGIVSVDPDITGWGANQYGAKWFNRVDMQWKSYNGIEIVLLG
jgi:hypothetical protein